MSTQPPDPVKLHKLSNYLWQDKHLWRHPGNKRKRESERFPANKIIFYNNLSSPFDSYDKIAQEPLNMILFGDSCE